VERSSVKVFFFFGVLFTIFYERERNKKKSGSGKKFGDGACNVKTCSLQELNTRSGTDIHKRNNCSSTIFRYCRPAYLI